MVWPSQVTWRRVVVFVYYFNGDPSGINQFVFGGEHYTTRCVRINTTSNNKTNKRSVTWNGNDVHKVDIPRPYLCFSMPVPICNGFWRFTKIDVCHLCLEFCFFISLTLILSFDLSSALVSDIVDVPLQYNNSTFFN